MPTPTDDDSDSQNLQQRGYSDLHLKVLRAYEKRWEGQGSLPFETIVMEGMGPFSRGKIWSYLSGLGAKVSEIGDTSSPEVLVLGRDRVDTGKVHRLLQRRSGKPLRICSQEMLLAWSMTGVDPNERPKTADTFIEGHPALESVRNYLDGSWPGTKPIRSSGGGEAEEFGPEESPLKRLGYSVGHDGESRGARRDALREAFSARRESFPGEYPPGHLDEWGPAESGARLKRIADHIAGVCTSFKQKDGNYDLAIDQWERDLQWLKDEYYGPLTYGFTWPEAE